MIGPDAMQTLERIDKTMETLFLSLRQFQLDIVANEAKEREAEAELRRVIAELSAILPTEE